MRWRWKLRNVRARRPPAECVTRLTWGREQASSQLKPGFPTHATTALCTLQDEIADTCHGHGGDTHGVLLPHHNTPGRFGRPRRNSVRWVMHHRLCTSRRDRCNLGTCSSQRDGATRNEPAP
eukprot:3435331-Prymnesium_polylepis.1